MQPEDAKFVSKFCDIEARAKMIKYAIKNCPSAGVFLRSDPTHPISWSLLSNYGHIMHLYTLEEHRGKGYGKIVVLSLMEQILEAGLIPALEIAVGNVPSAKLFTELNFVESFPGNTSWKQFIKSE